MTICSGWSCICSCHRVFWIINRNDYGSYCVNDIRGFPFSAVHQKLFFFFLVKKNNCSCIVSYWHSPYLGFYLTPNSQFSQTCIGKPKDVKFSKCEIVRDGSRDFCFSSR